MQALARANEVRLARAALKRQVAAGAPQRHGRRPRVPVGGREHDRQRAALRAAPLGTARSRKLIVAAGLTETKRLGTLTERQRGLLARALEEKAAATA